MNVKPGDVYTSSKLMDDPNFIDSIILIVSNDVNGSFGFVLNKIFYRTLNELTEFRTMHSFPLYIGGPVNQEHLYIIHASNDLVTGGTHIAGNFYFGGAFNQVIYGIRSGTITTKNIKLFLGYCGWNANELENEINEGSWRKIDADTINVFE